MAGALPILMYHHVSPAPGLVTVSPENFHRQMAALARGGYRTAGLEAVADLLAGRPLPPKTVVLTFDDGYFDNWHHAYPILKEFGFRAVVFLITGWLGDGPVRTAGETPSHRECMARVQGACPSDVMLRWSEVEAMAADGTVEFHSHTHTHTRWDRQVSDPGIRRERLAEDLHASRTALARQLGNASPHLCWPQGYHDSDYRDVARQQGFSYLYTVTRGSCLPTSDPLQIPRIVVKDRGGLWLTTRLGIYRQPWLARVYAAARRDGT